MFKFISAKEYSIFDNWPSHWPDKKYYASQHEVTEAQYKKLAALIEAGATETEIEACLAENPEILALTLFLFSTGHHASWIYPKPVIRPSSGNAGGLIPDYVLAGASSEGIVWWVLELKGANHSAFIKQGKRVFLSQEANKGVCQLLNYIDLSSRSQGYLRDELKLAGFREPTGLLLIGHEHESKDEQVMEFKNAWNRINPRVRIRSYSSLLRIVAKKLNRDDG